MALVLKDRVKGWTDSYGEDNFVIFATTNGYQSFSVIGNGNQTYYTVFDPTNYDWEVGIGTYTAATTTLSRDTILSSSNNNLIVSFLPGTKELFVGYPAEKAVTLDTPQTVTDKTLVNATVTSGTINNTTIGATTPASGAFTTLVASGASLTSVNAGVALLTSATVTTLNATGASIASANIGNLQFTAASIASINAGVAVITNLSATSASIASMNASVALLTTATVTTLNATGASIASANIGNLQFTAASIASINAGVAVITNLTATGASIASANVGTAVITAATVTGASIASANVGTAVITTGTVTNLTSTSASVASINAAVALITTGTVTTLTATGASVASANVGTAVVTGLTATGASIASVNAGVAVLAAGTAALPSLTTTGDTNTGIFFPAADTVGFSTGGSERMRLDTSGNLGLGVVPGAWDTGNSVKALQISSAGALWNFSTNNIYLSQNVIWNGTNRVYNVTGSLASEFSMLNGVFTFSNAASGTAGNTITLSERMRIDSSGNVGIGTASPGQKLEVAGNVLLSNNQYLGIKDTTGNAVGFPIFTGSNDAIFGYLAGGSTGISTYQFRTGNNVERMRIDSSGNVGIGVTPTVNLDVKNAGGNCTISAQYGTGTKGQLIAASNEVQLKAFNGTNDVMTFVTGASERMRITSGGDVYIGSTTDLGAAAQMQIVGAEADKLAMRCSDATAGNYWRLSVDSGNTFYVQNHNAAGVYITNGGTSWTGTSDERFKTDLKPIKDSLNKVCQLRSVTGRFKTDEESVSRSFLIAQDVLAVLPEAVDARNPEKLGVAYTDVIPLLVAAIKELSAKVAALEAK